MRIRQVRRGLSARYAVCSCASETGMLHSTRMHRVTLGTAMLVVTLAAEPGRSQALPSTEAAVADAHTAAQPADRRVSCDLARTDASRTRRGRGDVHRSGRRSLA